ncbi:MAG: hydroxyacid dehydrogenase [Smithellaceae bacterium]|nr:hydroxyacid dehydrogenase [Smithellaceae bacterium]
MPYKVLIPQDIVAEGKDYLLARGYEIKMGRGITPEEIAADVAGCDAILARTANFPARVIEAGDRLKVISRHGIGTDNIDVAKATQRGIWVTYAPESNANTVAEYTIGCLLALARQFIRADRETRGGNWEIRNKLPGSDLEGQVLGIVGLGRIGRRVARKAALGLDMLVLGYDPFLNPEQFPDQVRPVAKIEELLSTADFVTIHIPATETSKGSFGRKEFQLMKKSAYFINASRGDIIDEAALLESLQQGDIAGAALDVFAKEPADRDNPLFRLDNVLVTPHNAALTRQCMTRMALHAARGIEEVLSGKRPTWPVNDPQKGGR